MNCVFSLLYQPLGHKKRVGICIETAALADSLWSGRCSLNILRQARCPAQENNGKLWLKTAHLALPSQFENKSCQSHLCLALHLGTVKHEKSPRSLVHAAERWAPEVNLLGTCSTWTMLSPDLPLILEASSPNPWPLTLDVGLCRLEHFSMASAAALRERTTTWNPAAALKVVDPVVSMSERGSPNAPPPIWQTIVAAPGQT